MLNYRNRLGNPATFETLQEVCENAPKATPRLFGRDRIPRIANPVFESFPNDLMYFYRSPNLYCCETAARNNTLFVLFADRRYETKAEAYTLLEQLGLTELIDRIIGSIILVMPQHDDGYTEQDLQYAYTAFRALLSPKERISVNGTECCPAESEYCGGYGKTYFFGIGAGATFLYNHAAGSRTELIGRVAGFFAYGGEMAEDVTVNGYVPAHLVNATGTAVRKFREANGCDAYAYENGVASYYNQSLPLRSVRTAIDTENAPGLWMKRAYLEMFMFLQRTSNLPAGYTEPKITNPYRGYVAAPPISRYSLSSRNPVIDNRTVIGDLQVTFVHDPERFSDNKITENKAEGHFQSLMADENDYLDTWYEILPQQVLNHTAPMHSVPLIVANHGGGDDPLMFLDETGLLLTAGKEQLAIAAGVHGGLTFIGGDAFVGEALSRLAMYLLEEYPELDPERVYVTGYSMGGMATYSCIGTHPELYAAAAPMAMPFWGTPEGYADKCKAFQMPVMLITSTNDFAGWEPAVNHISDGVQLLFKTYRGYNGIEIPEQFDFNNYPFIGQPSDSMKITTVNGEWRNFEWLINGPAGYPLLGLNVTEHLQHSLWPCHGDIAWSFLRHYRRDTATGSIVYTE